MRPTPGQLILTVLAGGWLCCLAAGQVARTQSGQALDASYQVGSGGINTAPRSTRFDSQLYVTGQVTGLGAFRGGVGYFAADQLRLTVPSGGLARFQRQSVGLGDAMRGGTYSPSAYYDRGATAFQLREILAGRAAPGTNVPPTGAGAAVSSKAYVDAMRRHSLLALPAGAGGPVDLTGATGVVSDVEGGGLRNVLARPGTSAPFDLVGLREQVSLAQELHALARDGEPPGGSVTAGPDGGPRAPEAPAGPDAKAARPPAHKIEDLVWTGKELAQPKLDAEPDAQPGKRTERATPGGKPETPGLKGIDPAKLPGAELPGEEGARPELSDLPETKLDLPKIRFRTGAGTLVIRSLRGGGSGAFNAHMRLGAEALKAGRYYDADAAYALAAALDPTNPMASLGRALAMFGAGESYNAGLHLRQAMALYPDLMRIPVEVPGILGAAAAKRSLSELEARLARQTDSPQPMLVLVAAFVRHNAAQAAQAKRWARTLRRAAPDEKLLGAYAEMILADTSSPATD